MTRLKSFHCGWTRALIIHGNILIAAQTLISSRPGWSTQAPLYLCVLMSFFFFFYNVPESFMVFSFCHSGMHALWNAILTAMPDKDCCNCVPFLSNEPKHNTATVIIKTAELLTADVNEWLRSDVAERFLSREMWSSACDFTYCCHHPHRCIPLLSYPSHKGLWSSWNSWFNIPFLIPWCECVAIDACRRQPFNFWVCCTGNLLILWRVRDWKTVSIDLNWSTHLFYFHMFFIRNMCRESDCCIPPKCICLLSLFN